MNRNVTCLARIAESCPLLLHLLLNLLQNPLAHFCCAILKRSFYFQLQGVAIGPYMVWPPETELLNTKRIAGRAKCIKPDRVATLEPISRGEERCMKHAPTQRLVEALSIHRPYPMFGDSLLPVSLDKTLGIVSAISGYSILIGLEQMEDLFSVGFKARTKKEAYLFLEDEFMRNTPNGTKQELDAILDVYFRSIDNDDQIRIAHTVREVISDASFHCSTVLFIERLAKSNNIYFYFNHYPLATNDKKLTKLYAVHADDAHFLLGQPLRPDFFHKYNQTDRYVSLELIKTFGNFIKTGKTFWPPVSNGNEGLKLTRWNINAEVDPHQVDEYTVQGLCKRWNKFFGLFV